jgi:hypothetical protein
MFANSLKLEMEPKFLLEIMISIRHVGAAHIPEIMISISGM